MFVDEAFRFDYGRIDAEPDWHGDYILKCHESAHRRLSLGRIIAYRLSHDGQFSKLCAQPLCGVLKHLIRSGNHHTHVGTKTVICDLEIGMQSHFVLIIIA